MEHDNSYKLLFSEPQTVIDLLQGFVHEPWVDELDFATLEKVPTKFVADDLRDREDDVIWKVRCQDQWLYVYLLIEFQSSVDYFMAVRLMVYIGLLYQDLIKQYRLGKNDKLPPVFPVVLYNGENRWTAATELSELIEDLPTAFKKYKPSLEYLILDEGRFKNEELEPLKNLVAAIFRLENCKTNQDIVKVLDDLIDWLQTPELENLRRTFNIWIKRVLLRSGKIKEPVSNLHDMSEVRTMLSNTIAGWFDEYEQKGLEKGLEKGKQEQKIEMLQQERSVFKAMIKVRFGVEVADTAEALLAEVSLSEDFMQIGQWIIVCQTVQEFMDNLQGLLNRKQVD